jgi:D-arabinose 1-dehydrogenase-like Zn-dependent alcohol dehydrogenase
MQLPQCTFFFFSILAHVSISYIVGSLCAGVTVYGALKNSGAIAGNFVVIPGAGGGLGHLALQYARIMGLRTVAIDTGADKEKLCNELGAAGISFVFTMSQYEINYTIANFTAWIDFKKEKDIVAAVKRVTEGIGAHAAIVAAASADSYEKALEYLRPRGTLVAVGLPTDTKIKADVFFTGMLRTLTQFKIMTSQNKFASCPHIIFMHTKPFVFSARVEENHWIIRRKSPRCSRSARPCG